MVKWIRLITTKAQDYFRKVKQDKITRQFIAWGNAWGEYTRTQQTGEILSKRGEYHGIEYIYHVSNPPVHLGHIYEEVDMDLKTKEKIVISSYKKIYIINRGRKRIDGT